MTGAIISRLSEHKSGSRKNVINYNLKDYHKNLKMTPNFDSGVDSAMLLHNKKQWEPGRIQLNFVNHSKLKVNRFNHCSYFI